MDYVFTHIIYHQVAAIE